jgi:hypothetical protein
VVVVYHPRGAEFTDPALDREIARTARAVAPGRARLSRSGFYLGRGERDLNFPCSTETLA